MMDCSTIGVPWYCHICDGTFHPPGGGGVCSVCLKPTCRGHLKWTYRKDPESGTRRLRFVCRTCRGLHETALETDRTIQWIARPNYVLRLIVLPVIALAFLIIIHSVSVLDIRIDGINVADLVQMVDAALDGLVLLGAGVAFLVTLENRQKRGRVINAVNRLRCIAHIIDMHQLTKDPDSLLKISLPTPNSPKRTMNEYELGRYLDYCTEMLSLVSKTGFLYVQDYHDPVATEAVNDLEDLATGLSRKIWQKIMIIHSTAAPRPS